MSSLETNHCVLPVVVNQRSAFPLSDICTACRFVVHIEGKALSCMPSARHMYLMARNERVALLASLQLALRGLGRLFYSLVPDVLS